MPQLFGPDVNKRVRAGVAIAPLVMAAVGAGVWLVWWSPYMTRQNVALDQPVPFSHEHHVSGLGIDCRYCHTTVEHGATAGLPPTETCMTCHSQVWTEAPVLAPVRASWISGRPVKWNRVHDVPAFVFFNHGIHVQKGIGCSECHGRVDRMPLVSQAHSLWMKWCLDCHRHPERQIRPKEEVFNMNYETPTNQLELGQTLLAKYDIHPSQLTDCSICHR